MSPYTSTSSPPLGNPSAISSTFGHLLSRKRRKYLGIVLFVGALLAVWDVNLRREAGEWEEGGVSTGAGGGLGGKIWGDIGRSGVFGSGVGVGSDDDDDVVVPGGLSGELSLLRSLPSSPLSLSVVVRLPAFLAFLHNRVLIILPCSAFLR